MNPEIEDYIKRQLLNGFTQDQIRDQLSASGWKPEDINKTFLAQKQAIALEQIKALSTTSPKSSNHMKMAIIATLLAMVLMMLGMYFFLGSSIKNQKPKYNNTGAHTSPVQTQ